MELSTLNGVVVDRRLRSFNQPLFTLMVIGCVVSFDSILWIFIGMKEMTFY